MFQLTREVRFALNDTQDDLTARPANGFGGFPSLRGLGRYFQLQVTLQGVLDPHTGYLCNIRQIDSEVRRRAIPLVRRQLEQGPALGEMLAINLCHELAHAWPGAELVRLSLRLTPFFSVEANPLELPMIQLSQKFEFSASHRLHNPALSEADNQRYYGKCNNPHGHGHNYELKVTLRGKPDSGGQLIPLDRFEKIVQQAVIERFDHRYLNLEIPEFAQQIPTVENIAQVIYHLLRPALAGEQAQLASVTVWETPKTWCEYTE